jgi:methylenetetrahydrofolate dehydrogenase (NADP+)/methenyltetrahydrofolate cyclohydrolase
MTRILDGRELAASIRDQLRDHVDQLVAAGHRPTLATIHMGTDPGAATYVEMKQRDCDRIGIDGRHIDIDVDTDAQALYETIEKLNADSAVDGIMIQDDTPPHVDWMGAVRRIDPTKDVDGLHPDNLGRLVAGDPRFVPCTPLGIERLLTANGVTIEGADVAIVNHSNIVGKPLANLLVQKTDGSAGVAAKAATAAPNATVTVCHSATEELASKTRAADIVVVAVGIPEFLDGTMITDGTTVVDVGVSTVEHEDGGREQVGDVEVESVAPKASHLTPNPGGVGPMTRAMLLYNTVRAAGLRADIDRQQLPGQVAQ